MYSGDMFVVGNEFRIVVVAILSYTDHICDNSIILI